LKTAAHKISFQHVLQAEDQLAASMHAKTKSFGANTTWTRRRWHFIIVACLIWFSIGALFVYGYHIDQIRGWAMLFLMEGVVGLWAINMSFWLLHFKKTMLKNAGFHDRLKEELSNVVSDKGWSQSTPSSTHIFTWEAFDRIIHTADHILAYRFGGNCLVAPKSVLSGEEFECLGALCKAYVPNYIFIR
jgi:YcxB-like protein